MDASFSVALLAFVTSIGTFVVGIKWPKIKSGAGRFPIAVERIANDSRLRAGAFFLIALYFGISAFLYMHSLRNDLDTYVMPRVVTERQSHDLREFLSHHETYAVTVKFIPSDQKSSRYSGQLVDALKRANWDVTWSSGQPMEPNNAGLCVEAEGKPKPGSGHDPQQLLMQAFAAAHIEAGCSGGGGDGPYMLYLQVGLRPLVLGDQESTLSKLGRWIMHLGGAVPES